MEQVKKSKLLIVLAFLSIYIIWGSTYMLNKVAVKEVPPFLLAGLRFLLAGILIFIIAKGMGMSLKISKKQFKNTLIAGFFFLTFGNGLAVWALKYLDSGFVALEISAQPLVILLMMWALEGKKIKSKSLIGVGLGVLGIFLLVSQKDLITSDQMVIGMIMIFACMLAWSYGSLFVAKAELPKNFFINTGYQMFLGGLMLFGASLAFGENWESPVLWSVPTLYSIIGLVVFGSIVAFTSFNYLLRIVSPEKVATSAYINPIVALFLGWYFLGEVVSGMSIIAAIVLLTGVYFINSNK